MSPEVYYFSGTGNSLAVAKKIAAATGGSMISISSVAEQESIRPQADRIGIVFPCYLAQLNGIPPVVQEFVSKLRGAEDKYIFAVCTCGGYESVDALPTLKRLRRLLSRQGA
ncbi:MAG: EFR1 family ferrodoxin [Clostridiales bacterium]|nr:EFR1 family ferrodoxin [Clostridiales bacterium]